MKKLCFLVLIMSAVAYSCSDKSKPSFPEKGQYNFTGITFTNDLGQKLSDDPTDWNFSDKWGSYESSLFLNMGTSTSCPFPENMSVTFFPNPSATYGSVLNIQYPLETVFEYRIVDSYLDTLKTGTVTGEGRQTQITLKLDSLPGLKDTVIRMYYRFITPLNCEFRGHGDILIGKR